MGARVPSMWKSQRGYRRRRRKRMAFQYHACRITSVGGGRGNKIPKLREPQGCVGKRGTDKNEFERIVERERPCVSNR